MSSISDKQKERLLNEDILWLSTVKPNNSPHLVPIWYIFKENKIFLCTAKNSVKIRNIKKNNNVSFSLQDGKKPVVGVGEAIVYSVKGSDNSINELFIQKYNWNIQTDSDYDSIIEITVKKMIF